MLRLAAALIACTLALSACVSPVTARSAIAADAVQSGIQRTTNRFAIKEGRELFLDRYVEGDLRGADRRPVFIHAVGGGWETGDRADPGSIGYLEHFASLGFVVVSIDYRLGIKEAKERGELTAQNMRSMYLRAIRWGVEDIYDATAHVLAHADEWNIDPDRVVISGASAGATNALVAEFNLANQTGLARTRLPQGFRYAGVISMAGAFWLEDNTPFAWKRAPAPMMFIHGGKDQLVTYDADVAGSAYGPLYAQRELASQNFSSWFIDLPEADHTMAFAGMIDYRDEIEAFLTKMVWGKQALSIHTVERGKIAKTFGNLAKLYREYLPPELLRVLGEAAE